jgi:hypothetical protein
MDLKRYSTCMDQETLLWLKEQLHTLPPAQTSSYTSFLLELYCRDPGDVKQYKVLRRPVQLCLTHGCNHPTLFHHHTRQMEDCWRMEVLHTRHD